MDAYALVRTSIRRWYISLPLLLAAIVVCIMVAQSSNAVVSRQQSFVLVSPPVAAADAAGNPLTSSTVFASMLQRLNSPDTLDTLENQPGVTLSASPTTNGTTVLVLEVSGPSKESTGAALQSYVQVAQQFLSDLQARVDAPQPTFFRLVPLTSGVPTIDYPKRNLSVGLAGFGCLVLLLLLTQAADGLLSRGRRRASRLAAGQDAAIPRHAEPAPGRPNGSSGAKADRDARDVSESTPAPGVSA